MDFLIIGTRFAESHIKWINETESGVVKALAYKADAEHAHEVAGRHGIKIVTNDPFRVIRSKSVDAIVAVTPPDLHADFILAGLENDLFVVSDKPLAQNSQNTSLLAEKARLAKGKVAVTFQWRAHPAFQELRRLYLGGGFGETIHINLEFHHDFLAGPGTNWPWRHTSEIGGAGSLGDQGVHLFDLLRFIAPHKWRVTASQLSVAWKKRESQGAYIEGQTDDLADVLLKTSDSKAKARIFTSRVSIGRRKILVYIQGTSAIASVEIDPDTAGGFSVVTRTGGSSERFDYAPDGLNPYNAIVNEFRNNKVIETLEVANFDDGHAAQLLLEEALNSAS